MYVIHEIMHCKPGKVREMVKRFKALSDLAPKMGLKPFRVVTDVSGQPYWTVMAIMEAETLDGFFGAMENSPADEEAGRIMEGYHDLIVSGRREIYKIEK